MRKSFTHHGARFFIRGKTEQEIEFKIAEKIKELERGKMPTLEDWANTCTNTYKTNLQGYSLTNYIYRQRAVIKPLARLKIDDIRAIDCQMCINLQKGNSTYQIKQTAYILRWLFRKAIENGLITQNPAANLELPKGTKDERRALNEKERKAFRQAFMEDPNKYLIFALSYYCGLRPSEARALKTSDMVQICGKPYFNVRGTKTAASKRLVPIPEVLFERINIANEFVAVQESGKPHSKESSFRYFEYLRKKMPQTCEDITPYSLRHDYASRLVGHVDVTTISQLLGHSNIKTTMIYLHYNTNDILNSYDIINSI